jgi:hypothetical protein
MKTFKFKRVVVDYCDIEAADIDAAWEIIYSGTADWEHDATISIEELTNEDAY